LDSTGLPLGALLETEYEDREVNLRDDDILVMFTDGIVDVRDSNNRCFGIDGVVDAVNRNRDLSAKDLANELYVQGTQFMKDCPQQDDITIVIVKANQGYLVAQQEQPIKTKKMRVTSSVKYIKKVRSEVEEIATEMGFSPEDVFNIKLAINEAHANVIEHAYSGSDSGDILFQFLTYQDRLEIVIKDFGQGMGAKTTKGDDQLEELEGSGLGVFLIKTVMDRVRYKRTLKVGTELWLTKFISGKSKYP